MMTIHNALNQRGIDLKLFVMKCEEFLEFLPDLAKELNSEEKATCEDMEKILVKVLNEHYSCQRKRVEKLGFDV